MFLVWWRVIVTIFAHQLGRYNEELLGVLHHEGGHAGQDRVAGLSRMNMSLRRWQIICPTWSSSGFSHRGHTRWVIKIVAREEADILFSASRACTVYTYSQILWKAVRDVDYRGAMEHVQEVFQQPTLRTGHQLNIKDQQPQLGIIESKYWHKIPQLIFDVPDCKEKHLQEQPQAWQPIIPVFPSEASDCLEAEVGKQGLLQSTQQGLQRGGCLVHAATQLHTILYFNQQLMQYHAIPELLLVQVQPLTVFQPFQKLLLLPHGSILPENPFLLKWPIQSKELDHLQLFVF